jgi:hypothetical protein
MTKYRLKDSGIKVSDDIQTELYRRMSVSDKLKTASRLYWSARALKAMGLRRQHPRWSDPQIEKEVTRIFIYART